MKKILNKQSLIILMTLVLTLSVLTIAFCVRVISKIPDFESDSYLKPTAFLSNEEREYLDSTVEVRLSELKTFFLWSDQRGQFDDWLKLNEKANALHLNKNKTLATTEEKIFIGRIKKNDCETVYCLQKKLPFSQIPSLLWRGLIGIEDYRYLDHKGIDPRGLLRALWHDIKVMRFEQGGSTLTQQLVKNLYFSSERKISRKIKEMIVSVYLEWKYSKEDILAAYFNEVEWGAHQGIKIKGINASSLMYFNKKPEGLTAYEVSILIGLLKGPYFYSPYRYSERLRERSKIVFDKLIKLNLVSEQSTYWSDKKYESWIKDLKKRNDETTVKSLWMMGEKKNKSYPFYVLLNQQNTLIKKLKEQYPDTDWSSKVSVWKLSEGQYVNSFRHYTKVERNQDKAFKEERHQVGSLLKPVIYNILTKKGIGLQDEVSTKRLELKLKSGLWSPRESHKITKKTTTHYEALIKSMNNPIIRGVQQVGFDKVEQSLKKLIPTLLTPLSEYPAQILGSVELSIDEISNVYQKFFLDACSHDGGQSVLDALSDPLQTTIRFRVGKNFGQMRFFGKTGTTNKGVSNWFIGHSGDELFISWVGVEDASTIQKKLSAYGSNTSFLLFKSFYEHGGRLFSELSCNN